MSNPQVEDGYTIIANELLEALIKRKLSGQELRLILFIVRKTYGYHKKEDKISYGQIAKGLNIKRSNACRLLKRLLLSKMITPVIKNDNTLTNTLIFNKDYEKWGVLSNLITVIKNDNKVLSKRRTTKETITKENYNTRSTSSSQEVEQMNNILDTKNKDIKEQIKKNKEHIKQHINTINSNNPAKPTQPNPKSNKTPYSEIIDYLNDKTHRAYRITEAHKKLIDARINEGYGVADFKKVIDNKCDEWLNDSKYHRFLRPLTLFSNKFDSYLQEDK